VSDGDHAPAEGGVAGSDVRGHVEQTFRDESGRVVPSGVYLARMRATWGDGSMSEAEAKLVRVR